MTDDLGVVMFEGQKQSESRVICTTPNWGASGKTRTANSRVPVSITYNKIDLSEGSAEVLFSFYKTPVLSGLRYAVTGQEGGAAEDSFIFEENTRHLRLPYKTETSILVLGQ